MNIATKTISAFEILKLREIVPLPYDERETVLQCKQTKGGNYNSHPEAYFHTDDPFKMEDEVIEFYTQRGFNEGLTNWIALATLKSQGFRVKVKMVT